MKIIKLGKQEQKLFAWMDPFMVLEHLEFPDCFAFGAETEPQDDEKKLPAALMVCLLRENKLIVEWLFVAEQFRLQGIGDQLLSTAMEFAKEKQLAAVCADLTKEFGQELICDGAERYLQEHLLTEEQELPGQWLTDLESLSVNPFFRDKPDAFPQISPISILNRTDLQNTVKVFTEKATAKALYPVSGEEERLDQNISCILKNQNSVCGLFLVQSAASTLYPILLSARSLEEANALLYFALMAAKKKYHRPMDVRVILHDQTMRPLLEKILPDQRISCMRYTVSLDTYQKKGLRLSLDMSCAEYNRKLDELIEQETPSEDTQAASTESEKVRPTNKQDLILTLQDVKQCKPLFTGQFPDQVEPVGNLELQQLHAMLLWCHAKRPCTWFEENIAALPITWFELELSCCVKNGQEVEGILLIHTETSGRLWVEYLMVTGQQSDRHIAPMLQFAARKALEKYSSETEIGIRCHTDRIVKMTEKLFPGKYETTGLM